MILVGKEFVWNNSARFWNTTDYSCLVRNPGLRAQALLFSSTGGYFTSESWIVRDDGLDAPYRKLVPWQPIP